MVSIIMTAYNHLNDLTIPCLKNLRAATHVPHELCLVDDGSKDGTYQYFRRVSRKSYKMPENSGGAKAGNMGLKMASMPYVVFLDNDMFVPRGWLKVLLRAAQKQNVGIAAGIPSNETRKLKLPRSADGLIDVDELGGSNMIMSRYLIQEIGGLDESIDYAGYDTDLCYRARIAGYRVALIPGLVPEHRNHGTLGDPRFAQLKARSIQRFRDKWKPYHGIFELA